MLYLLFVLTFLCGILFYGMSPSDKSLDMTAHQAEGMILSFVNQHQAAKDYLYTWLGVGLPNNANSNLRSDSDSRLKPDFIEMMPPIYSDICDGNVGTPGWNCQYKSKPFPGFISRVVCTNSAGTTTVNCNAAGAKQYVMTYGGWDCKKDGGGNCIAGTYIRPDWWPSKGTRMRRFESWRKAIANRTRGSITCGFLVKMGANWCLDNGETVYKNESVPSTCMNQIPTAVITELGSDYATDSGKDDLLFCISEFKQGVQPGHYAVSPTYFYDGLSNAGIGQHQNSGTSWTNLIDNTSISWTPVLTGAAIQDAQWLANTKPYLTLHGFLNTGIQLGSTYTLTIVLSAYSNGSAVSCGLLQTANAPDTAVVNQTIFTKLGSGERLDNTDAVRLITPTLEKDASICNMNSNGNNTGIVSWTFVVDGTKLDVYENAKRRFANETIESTNEKYLLLGNSDGTQIPLIYSVRYYNSLLTDKQIQKNFKVDQKRFGIPDINNGNTGDTCVNETEVKRQEV